MTPTTSDAIFDALRAAVLAITPSYEARRSAAWTKVDRPDVEELRRFYLQGQAPGSIVEAPGDKIYSNGEHLEIRVHVVVGYGTLPEGEDDLRLHLTTRDFLDLRNKFKSLVGVVDGLVRVEPDGAALPEWDGNRWPRVRFPFLVGYMQETQ